MPKYKRIYHRHHHRKAPPRAPRVKAKFRKQRGKYMSSTLVTIVLPTTRTDGTALALSDIASVVLSKAVGAATATVVDTVTAPTTGTVTFVDTSPDFGQTDNYSAVVTDVEGNTSAAGTASVAVPPSVLAAPSAPTVTATFQP
jgi:hypothetical protein